MTEALVATPKVSVCIRSHNFESYIAQAIESVIAQETDFPYEVLIADDCSTDGTREVLERFRRSHPTVIRLLLHERRVGGRQAFVEVNRACRGEYVAILDGDDYWTSSRKLSRQVEVLDAHADWTMCFHRMRCFYEHEDTDPFVWPATRLRHVLRLEDLLTDCSIPASAIMYRNGLLDPYWEWLLGAPPPGDWCVAILLGSRGAIGFLDEEMADFRIRARGAAPRRTYQEGVSQMVRMLRAVSGLLEPRYLWQIRRTILRLRAASWLRSLVPAAAVPALRRAVRRGRERRLLLERRRRQGEPAEGR